MQRVSVVLFFAIALGPSAVFHAQAAGGARSLLEPLAIRITSPSRPFVYTNKASAFLYGETNDFNHPGWEGFTVFGHKFLDDVLVTVNGKQPDRHTATTTIYPDFLRRVYPEGIVWKKFIRWTVSLHFLSPLRFRHPRKQALYHFLLTAGTKETSTLSSRPAQHSSRGRVINGVLLRRTTRSGWRFMPRASLHPEDRADREQTLGSWLVFFQDYDVHNRHRSRGYPGQYGASCAPCHGRNCPSVTGTATEDGDPAPGI